MARTTRPRVRRRRIVRTVAVLAGLAAAGWYGYTQLTLTGMSRSWAVDAASRTAEAESEHRLEEIVDGLPGVSRQLGASATDHCRRHVPFEGESAGPLGCQWRMDRYVVLDGDTRTAGEAWAKALGEDRWTGARAPFPADYAATSERYEYRDPKTRDSLVVTIVEDSRELHVIDDPRFIEPWEEYRREQRSFTGRKAAEHVVSEGGRVARISFVRAYYGQEGSAPFGPKL
ncbi:hypothetical protein I3F58_12660 [Streptomyces sp. MUM 203J]|uniref:hypothetical protein n=1 Tax=Streptomyces sp. MUM 203J TaxID=2791990 RepID=UPI001F042D26|nr:hypothetical protein [Streptomyces sp. MUM 203J]MCH0540406.1 hypothetical protein [Streptomyces sp. MUM 203J]